MEHIPDDAADIVETLLSEMRKRYSSTGIYVDRCNDAIVAADKRKTLRIIQLGVTLIDKMIKYGRELNDAVDTIMKAEPWCCLPQLKENADKLLYNEDKQ